MSNESPEPRRLGFDQIPKETRRNSLNGLEYGSRVGTLYDAMRLQGGAKGCLNVKELRDYGILHIDEMFERCLIIRKARAIGPKKGRLFGRDDVGSIHKPRIYITLPDTKLVRLTRMGQEHIEVLQHVLTNARNIQKPLKEIHMDTVQFDKLKASGMIIEPED